MKGLRVGIAVAGTSLAFGVAAAPAAAHQNHTSCKGFGQGAANAAQTFRPFGQTFVRPAAEGGADEEVAGLHTLNCELRP